MKSWHLKTIDFAILVPTQVHSSPAKLLESRYSCIVGAGVCPFKQVIENTTTTMPTKHPYSYPWKWECWLPTRHYD
jgi:hypothetical protein